MAKKKIEKLLIVNYEKQFGKDTYIVMCFSDGEEVSMLYDDAIDFLKKQSFFNRFKSGEQLLSAYPNEVYDHDTFTRGKLGYKHRYDYTRLVDEKKESYSDFERSVGIVSYRLSMLYNKDIPYIYEEAYPMYEKIKTLVLDECEKGNIFYRTDSGAIIREVIDKINADPENYEKVPYPEDLDEYYKKRVELAKQGKDDLARIERDFNYMKFTVTSYTSSMFSFIYQMLGALCDKNIHNRGNILASWAEFLTVMIEYIDMLNKYDEYTKKLSLEKMQNNLDSYHQNEDFIRAIEELIVHDHEKEVYRYHATGSLRDGKNILEKGLFAHSSDLDSTSFPEFNVTDILTYEYGNMFRSVGDYIIVFREPIGEVIIRETTPIEKEQNRIMGRREGLTESVNRYVIDTKYIVGLIDKEHQKVYRVHKEQEFQEEKPKTM